MSTGVDSLLFWFQFRLHVSLFTSYLWEDALKKGDFYYSIYMCKYNCRPTVANLFFALYDWIPTNHYCKKFLLKAWSVKLSIKVIYVLLYQKAFSIAAQKYAINSEVFASILRHSLGEVKKIKLFLVILLNRKYYVAKNIFVLMTSKCKGIGIGQLALETRENIPAKIMMIIRAVTQIVVKQFS